MQAAGSKEALPQQLQQTATLSIITMNVSFAPEAKRFNALDLCLQGQHDVTPYVTLDGQPPNMRLRRAEYVANCHQRFNKSMYT